MSEFLAEAQVLVRPITTGFRAELEAQLLAETRGIAVPVNIVPTTAGGTAGAARAASQEAAQVTAAIRQQGAETEKAAVSTRTLTHAETLNATAASRLAVAQAEVTNAASAVGAAQTTATRSAAALAAAQRAIAVALATQDKELILAAQRTLGLAEAQNLDAAAALKSARAHEIQAAKMAQLSRGAGATGLSFFGLRGATLAASASFLVGAAAVTAFAKGIQQAADLQRELDVFQVTARATGDEMERVREQAVGLGRDVSLPAVSAGDAATAMTELAKAGLDVEESLAGARGVLQLSTAAQISNAEATEIAANALNAFNLAGSEATHVADLLANAANESQGSILDMGIALRQSAAVGRQLGLSLDQTVTLLTILARAGLAGSDAGTSLRVALTRLIAPTEKAAEEIDKLDVNLRDAQGNLRPDVFAQMGRAMEGIGKQEQARILFTIFGQDAQRAAAILAREGLPALEEMTLALDREGAAAEIAGARTKGFSGQIEGLSSELATVGTNLEFLLVPLGGVVSAFQAGAQGINLFFDALRGLGKETDNQIDKTRGFFGAIKDASDTTDDFIGGLVSGIPGIDRAGDAIARLGGGTADPLAQVKELNRAFEEQGSILADQPKLLQEILTRLGEFPTEEQIIALTLDPSRVHQVLDDLVERARANGDLSADALIEAFKRESQASAHTMTEPLRRGLSDFQAEAATAGKNAGDAFIASFNQAQVTGQLQAQKTAVAQAQAFGETGLEELIKERDRIDRILRSTRAPKGPALESLLNQRTAVINEIKAINERAASEAKSAVADAKRARDERDQAILDAIGVREQRAENAVIRAEATESARDDIAANKALRAVYVAALNEIRKTVQDAKTKAQEIAALTRELIQVNLEIRKARQELREERQREREERLRERAESLSLDVEIAEALGNRAREVRARKAEIEFLKRQIDHAKNGSIEQKRLILELRQKQKELRELKDETQKTKDAFKELSFEFLTTQQGFAANLFGNLIPTTAGGLVTPGAAAKPSAQVSQASALAAAQGAGTRTQSATQIDILRLILNELQAIRSGRAFPEATYQKHQTAGTMETHGY